jgi:hypothetical protein
MTSTSSTVREWAVRVAREAAWAPLLVLVIYFVTARLLHLFTAYPELDIPMHLAGGLAASFFFHRAVRLGSRLGLMGAGDPLTLGLLTFSLTCVVAIVWEFAEFSSDRLIRTHEQLGLEDTMLDLAFGMAGSLCFLALRSVVPRAKRA